MREWQSVAKDCKKVDSYAENQSGFAESYEGNTECLYGER